MKPWHHGLRLLYLDGSIVRIKMAAGLLMMAAWSGRAQQISSIGKLPGATASALAAPWSKTWQIGRQSASSPSGVYARGSRADEQTRSESEWTGRQASSYVPVDSWIYNAFDRLVALGYVHTSFQVVRPWSRLECARLLAEAHTNLQSSPDDTVRELVHVLDLEFQPETKVIDGAPNTGITLKSVYTRVTGIAGRPMRDGFHLGSTLVNDFGRPFGEGVSLISGFSGHAQAGPLAFYMRGEYQHAGTITPYNRAAQDAIAAEDSVYINGGPLPVNWNLRMGETNRPRFVEAYAALKFADWQFSFGQQSLWWSPNRMTSMILSNNAEAMPMFRLNNSKPIRLGSSVGGGLLKVDLFLARQGGIHFLGLGNDHQLYGSMDKPLRTAPFIWGAALSLKATENLEISFAHTVIFAGYGRPLNLKTFFHTFSKDGDGQPLDPGKRIEDFIFSYRLPGLRSVTLYNEAMTWDAPIHGKFVARYGMSPGFYISHFPGVRRLDLRGEGAYTNLPKLSYLDYFYANAHYVQGYTHFGQVIGSWIGREGSGGKAESTYWFSARNRASVSFTRKIVAHYSSGGGNMNDLGFHTTWMLKPDIEFTATGQFERWNFPLISNGPKHNFTTIFGVTFYPKTLNTGR